MSCWESKYAMLIEKAFRAYSEHRGWKTAELVGDIKAMAYHGFDAPNPYETMVDLMIDDMENKE